MPPRKKDDRAKGGLPGSLPTTLLATAGLMVFAAAYFAYRGRGHFRPPVLTPLKAPKMTDLGEFGSTYKDQMLWGSYRSGLYFGMRTRTPKGLLVGLLWFDPDDHSTLRQMRVRHDASQGDGLQSYGWLRHDGRSYGTQELIDGEYNITLSMVKSSAEGSGPGGDWAVRVQLSRTSGVTATRRRISVVLYVGDEDSPREPWEVMPDGEPQDLRTAPQQLMSGGAAALNGARFALHLRDSTPSSVSSGRSRGCRLDYLSMPMESKEYLLGVKDVMMHTMVERLQRQPSSTRFHLYLPNGASTGSDLAFFQATCSLPSTLDWTFTSQQLQGRGGASSSVSWEDRVAALSGPSLDSLLQRKAQEFDERFERVFGLRQAAAASAAVEAAARRSAAAADGDGSAGGNGSQDADGSSSAAFPEGTEEVAKAALSNLLGSIGYFFGSSRVRVEGKGSEPQLYWPAALFTAVPSRSFFPRGFLWDEGFHQLLVQRWDPQLSRDVIAHWLDLMNMQGWIPREQILGDEARQRVPEEFVVQNPTHANPPSMMLPIANMVKLLSGSDDTGAGDEERKAIGAFLRRAWPRLEAWYGWFNTTQAGLLPTSYRWHGRDPSATSELNPKTLTSGLDDYPRSSHPSDGERHLDLRCWMALASQVMGELGSALGLPDGQVAPYAATASRLSDLTLLQTLHYDQARGWFSDWGNHTENVVLERRTVVKPAPMPEPGQPPQPPQQEEVSYRVTRSAPVPQYVPSYGYVSLFPLLMQLLPLGPAAAAAAGDAGVQATPQQASAEGSRELLEAAFITLGSSPGGAYGAEGLRLLLQQLEHLRDEQLLWSPYGLRSLATTSSIYKKYNTLHDAPYWRGQIWMNINYLVLRALRRYSAAAAAAVDTAGGAGGDQGSRAVAQAAAALHDELRANLLRTLTHNYRTKGYLYEQYDDTDGRGVSSHPFTGWTALVTLIAAGNY